MINRRTCLIRGLTEFQVTSFQSNFASHNTRDRHVCFLFALFEHQCASVRAKPLRPDKEQLRSSRLLGRTQSKFN